MTAYVVGADVIRPLRTRYKKKKLQKNKEINQKGDW
jgi:hypothetical protein